MENVELARDLLFWIILFVILIVVVLYFIPYIFALSEQAQKKISPPTEEPKEEVLESQIKSLGILTTDSPEIKMFKLFKNFNPTFLNEQFGIKVMYNSFVLDLSGKSYGYNDELINNLIEGLGNFSLHDSSYQIGTDGQQIPNCGPAVSNNVINYNNDCWDALIDSAPNPCIVYVHGDGSNSFNGKVKIRVVWYRPGGTSLNTGRDIINVLVTVCDG